jgi:hypothetical protein
MAVAHGVVVDVKHSLTRMRLCMCSGRVWALVAYPEASGYATVWDLLCTQGNAQVSPGMVVVQQTGFRACICRVLLGCIQGSCEKIQMEAFCLLKQ